MVSAPFTVTRDASRPCSRFVPRDRPVADSRRADVRLFLYGASADGVLRHGGHGRLFGDDGPKDNRGVPVRVATWFSGRGAAPIVYLASNSFGDSPAVARTSRLRACDMIWVTSSPKTAAIRCRACAARTPSSARAEGDAMLKDAMATFGGVVPPGGTPTDPPGAPATDPPASSPEPPAVAPDDGVPILLGTVGLALALLFGVVLLARRQVRPDV